MDGYSGAKPLLAHNVVMIIMYNGLSNQRFIYCTKSPSEIQGKVSTNSISIN